MRVIKFICILIILGIYACYDDKGNYDYIELDKVVIDTTGLGIQARYSISRFDTLKISPKVYYNGELVNADNPQFDELEFQWEIYEKDFVNPILQGDTLSKEIGLIYPVNHSEINWELLFTVNNKKTDVKEYLKIQVKVNASLSEGWMVLYEKDGGTDVGLIVDKLIAPDVLKERVFYDIYSLSNEGALQGTPINIIYSLAGSPYSIFVLTSQNMARVDPITFGAEGLFEDLFWEAPSIKSPNYFTPLSTRKEIFINNGRVHTVSFLTMGSNRTNAFLNDECIGNYGELAPWIAKSISGIYECVVYDQTNKCFKKVDSGGSEVLPFPTQLDTEFNCNNVGYELVMGDAGRNKYEYVVTKDDSDNYFMLVANFTGEADKVGIGVYSMDQCENIRNINSVTAGYKGEIFYYSAGNSVYLYDYRLSNASTTAWQAPSDENVTCVRLQKYYYGEDTNTPVNDCEIIYIATYNESQNEGKVYQLRVNPTNGVIDNSSVKIFEGFGRIKDMAWKRS